MARQNADRGEANTLGIAIVLVLALSSALAITSLGSVALDQSQGVAETESGLRTMTELDTRASLVALNGGDAEKLDLTPRSDQGRATVDTSGELRFVMRNTTDGSTAWERTVSLGTVTYENGDEQIAYQGGGVWRRNTGTNGSVMVSPPELHYQQGTLTLPMINVSSTDRSLSTARIRKVSEERIYPNASRGADGRNPVTEGNELVLFVQSDYYRGWATFFEQRVGGDVTVYDSNQTVRVDLVAPEDRFKIDSGLVSVGAGGAPINMTGSGNNPTFLDSYDSASGNYTETKSKDGVVRSPSGLDLSGNTFVNGTVNTGGPLTLSGQDSKIRGDAFHQGLSLNGGGNNNNNGGGNNNGGSKITGIEKKNGSGVSIPPIDTTVNERVNTICDSASGSTLIVDSDLSGGLTLDSGKEYCFNGDLSLNGETLTIDVSSGNVSLAVEGDLSLNSGSEIKVTGSTIGSLGDNNAKLWLGGDSVEIRSSEVNVTDQRSPAFRLYGKSSTTVDIGAQGSGDDSKFVGLLYAPSESESGGSLDMNSDADLFGSAVVGEVNMRSGSAVHYDQALGGFSFNRQSTPASRLSYLYVTIHEIEIKDG